MPSIYVCPGTSEESCTHWLTMPGWCPMHPHVELVQKSSTAGGCDCGGRTPPCPICMSKPSAPAPQMKCRFCFQPIEEPDKVKAERDRYRKALEQIANAAELRLGFVGQRRVAREALSDAS